MMRLKAIGIGLIVFILALLLPDSDIKNTIATVLVFATSIFSACAYLVIQKLNEIIKYLKIVSKEES